jgi:hypothetical protein
MTRDKEEEEPLDGVEEPGAMSEAEIDANLAASFPASDPPSWTLGSDHSGEVPTKTDKQESDE